MLGESKNLLAAEIVEYNPSLDKEDKTAKLVADVISSMFDIK